MLKSAKEVEAKIRAARPGRWAVGDGAYLQVSQLSSNATASWLFRYQLNGKAREMGLGPVGLVSLAEAREKARTARKQLLEGNDPIDARNHAATRARFDAAKAITFKEAATQYIATHEAGWKNPKHAAQWPSTLKTYVYPVFGDMAVSDVDTGLILKSLEPIWTTKPETAGRVRSRIENILDWAKVRGYRQGDNPARWKGHLENALPRRSKVRAVKHHAAMPYVDLPAFMIELRQKQGLSARALELTILTAARSGEVLGAQWSEFNLADRVWTIPGSRMKAGKDHRVPLSQPVVELLEALPVIGDSPYLFPGIRSGKPLSNMAMLELMRGMRPGKGYVPHGMRSAFSDWAAEETAHPTQVVEQALAHQIGNAVEAAYRRGDLFEKRRRLMEDWGRHCGSG